MSLNGKLSGLLITTALAGSLMALPANAQSAQDLQAQINVLQQQLNTLQQALYNQQAAANEATERAAAAEAKAEQAVASAEAAAEKDSSGLMLSKAEPAMGIKTADGQFEMNLRGRIFADAGWVSDGDDTLDLKATEFRAARIGIEGKAWKTVKYKFEVDFADNEVDIKDAYLQWDGKVADFTFGQFKTPNSLEEISSSRHNTFMERASFTDAFSLARQMGIGANLGGKNWGLHTGVFRGSASADNEDEGLTVAARGWYGGEMENGVWLLGGSVRHRNVGDDQSLLRYRQRPHNHLSDRFIATSRFADKDTFYGIEGAVQMGPFHVSSEYAVLDTKLASGMGNDPKFHGGYVEAGWFITGESKVLKLDKGAWDRPKVDNPVFEGGSGAIQIAAKFDMIDLTDEGVFGGEQDTFIIGVNWYLNRHSRIMLNYSHSEIDNAFDVSANGSDGENDLDAFGMRFQVDW